MKKNRFLALLVLGTLSANVVTAQGTRPPNWKLGVALWTFHSFSLAESIRKVDSAGLHYIEGSVFQKAGDELEQSSVMGLSPEGIEKLKSYMAEHKIKMPSIYIFGGKTLKSW